ncbi:MAG: hypothetical protein V7711_05230 [Pseudomonadales bacterium]
MPKTKSVYSLASLFGLILICTNTSAREHWVCNDEEQDWSCKTVELQQAEIDVGGAPANTFVSNTSNSATQQSAVLDITPPVPPNSALGIPVEPTYVVQLMASESSSRLIELITQNDFSAKVYRYDTEEKTLYLLVTGYQPSKQQAETVNQELLPFLPADIKPWVRPTSDLTKMALVYDTTR